MDENAPNQGMSEPVIRFKCGFCGKQIRVPSIHAGKKGKCPQCKTPVVIPQLTLPPAVPRDDEPIRLIRDADLPPASVGPINASPQQWHRSIGEPPADADADTYETATPPEQKPATLLDVFSFPFSMSGIIHLLLFWFGPFLLGLFARVFAFACCYFQILVLGLYIAMIGYLYYYLSNCVIAAAKDERLAPDVSLDDPPAFTDLLRRVFLILGGTLLCFGPAFLYMLHFYILPAVGHFWVGHAGPINWRADHVYWLLYGLGVFLYPMFMLAASMFDSATALNPFLIIGSIFRTFLPYCGLAVIFCVIGLLMNLVGRLQPGGFFLLIWGLGIYLAFVAAYILGRFFRRYEDRLSWEIKL
jgi:hypothetical protein